MVTKQEVVSPERFASAQTYQEYMGTITQNKDEFENSFKGTSVPEEYKRRLQALVAKPNGPKKVLVIGEDWCPDVYRGMPVIQRLAEAAGIEMKVLARDQNLDVANAYLNKGEFLSVPTVIFFTDKLEQVLVWFERPQKANDELPQMREIIGGRTREEAGPDLKKFRAGPVWGSWRDATIVELTEKLEKAV